MMMLEFLRVDNVKSSTMTQFLKFLNFAGFSEKSFKFENKIKLNSEKNVLCNKTPCSTSIMQ
jgi:hypothetical protein